MVESHVGLSDAGHILTTPACASAGFTLISI